MLMLRYARLLTIIMLTCINSCECAPVGSRTDEDESGPPSKRTKPDAGPRCELFFSELKLKFSTTNLEVHPFIELQSVCKKRPGPVPRNVFGSYKVIIMESNPTALVTFIDMQNFPFDDKKPFIVVGSPMVPNLDISMSSPHVQSIFSRVVDQLMLPNPIEKSYGIFLLRDVTRKEARDLNLYINSEGMFLRRRLTNEQINLLIEKTADMIVLGPESVQRKQDFASFWKMDRSTYGNMFSHDWTLFENSLPEMSWSLCNPAYKGFNAEAYQLVPQSPGLPNSCPHLVDPSEFQVTTEDTASSAPSNPQEVLPTKIYHTLSENDYNLICEHNFNQERVSDCQQYFPKQDSILDYDNIKEWLDFDELQTCKFSCVACKRYLGLGFRPDFKHKTHMMTKGFFSNDIYDNKDQIRKHEKSELHQESMSFFQAIRNSNNYEEALAAIREFEKKEKCLYNATMNFLLVAYTEIKSSQSFQTHEAFMRTLRLIGANVGWHHHTIRGVHDIAMSLSNSFKKKVLQYMVDNDIPFSISVDASTTFSLPYLGAYIQLIENNVPGTYFYALIYLENGEKGKMMADALQNQVERDSQIVPSFLQHFKTFIVSIVSDGAANMVGINNSFRTHVIKFIGRNIPNIECLNHKLDNAFKMGVKQNKEVTDKVDTSTRTGQTQLWQLSYFQDFEKCTNDFYTFYMSRGHKRWLHLLDTADELGLIPKRIKYVFPIRWSDSHYRAIETIHHNYYALVEDLGKVQVDEGFDQAAKQRAAVLQRRMLDKTYMLVLHEFMDILTVYKIASKQFQEASSVIVGTVTIVNRVLDTLDELKESPGDWLRDFVASCVCPGKCDEGDCTLQDYDECPEVLLNNVKLVNHNSIALYYSYVRKTLYENMIKALKHYFKLELLESFEFLNPSRLIFTSAPNDDAVTLESFYKDEEVNGGYRFKTTPSDRIHYVCNFYGIDNLQCVQFEIEWRHLLTCITSLDDLKEFEDHGATVFWPYALTKCENFWTPLSMKLVKYALVTPFSSSEVERGFSIMNKIKTKDRSSMTKETLDALMRVKINGPDVEFLDSYEYTIDFMQYFARVDDATVNGGKQSSKKQTRSDHSGSTL